ncbi:hypothetical protein H7992_05090 [Sporosarcina sp. resist]|uniref:hypothetical protein n=1 Tax=Sporosarcina sp. resist TaxID=2762563 RepID=UPI00164D4089|nr:hypothetical protein [Sporosarcina sp. resist]QNK89101.1 hypothetical protein H7992_05090 [Sporosarcina sp. resist]
MDIKVRDVDVVSVKKIDQEAKKKGLSRNEFLKRHLDKFAQYDVFKEERNEFEKLWKENTKVMEEFLEAQINLYKKIERFEAIVLLLMDVDEEEVNERLAIVGLGSDRDNE